MISSARSRFSTVSIINSVFVFCSGRMRPDVPSIGIRISLMRSALQCCNLKNRCTIWVLFSILSSESPAAIVGIG